MVSMVSRGAAPVCVALIVVTHLNDSAIGRRSKLYITYSHDQLAYMGLVECPDSQDIMYTS